MAKPMVMPRSFRISRRNMFTAREAPPPPVWKENPSLKNGDSAMIFAQYSAIISSRTSLVSRTTLLTIFAGLPIWSTTHT